MCMLVRLCHSEQTELPVGPHLHEQWIEHVIGADDSNFSFSLGTEYVCLQVFINKSKYDTWTNIKMRIVL